MAFSSLWAMLWRCGILDMPVPRPCTSGLPGGQWVHLPGGLLEWGSWLCAHQGSGGVGSTWGTGCGGSGHVSLEVYSPCSRPVPRHSLSPYHEERRGSWASRPDYLSGCLFVLISSKTASPRPEKQIGEGKERVGWVTSSDRLMQVDRRCPRTVTQAPSPAATHTLPGPSQCQTLLCEATPEMSPRQLLQHQLQPARAAVPHSALAWGPACGRITTVSQVPRTVVRAGTESTQGTPLGMPTREGQLSPSLVRPPLLGRQEGGRLRSLSLSPDRASCKAWPSHPAVPAGDSGDWLAGSRLPPLLSNNSKSSWKTHFLNVSACSEEVGMEGWPGPEVENCSAHKGAKEFQMEGNIPKCLPLVREKGILVPGCF